MPEFVIHLANGRELVLEGDTAPSDADIEAAADSAGVRSLLMSDKGESGSSPTSNSNAASIVSALSGLAGAGMAAAPAIVATGGKVLTSKAAGIAPAAIALDAGTDALQGDYKKAGMKAATAAAVTQAVKMIPAAARVAGVARAASPAAAMASIISAGHSAKMNPRNAPKTKTLSTREIAELEIRRLVGEGM